MRFALIDNNRTEAQPKLNGLCCCCSKPVIAKCGTRKIWHWAHKSKTDCDNWWEPETEWHRTWKNNYPSDWQEISLLDISTKEKHIADIRTNHSLVIEFQHSNINPQERISRERFYKNMVWIVDGTRLKRDYPRFLKEWKRDGISEVRHTEKSGIFEVWFPEFCFPEAWLKSSVPVIFDFLGDGSIIDSEGLRNNLYCLFPQVGSHARVAEISRKAFINTTTNGEWTIRVQEFINEFRKQDQIKERENRQTIYSSNRRMYSWRGIPIIGYRKRRRRL
ncbi:competence protein CoiA [Flavobacterium sp.]|jgi:competence protein CoiA|uniref:competence protein CoiA n=1 Tax=Flavobacterium sp. TaxID=239 RepID=UPI0037BE9945